MDYCETLSVLQRLADFLRKGAGIAAKADIATVASRLGISGRSAIPAGDDCAAIADGDGFLLLAIEGFMNGFVAEEPWFAGWCGVMVNISDIAAMGGKPIAVVDALWADGDANAAPILAGLRAAAEAYGVPVIGGHSNLRNDRSQLSVAILGRAEKLLTSFDAKPGERLLAAVDLRGQYRPHFSNWDAASGAPPARLRGDLEILPALARAGLSKAAKDISQGGIIGTAIMLAECSGVEIVIDVDQVPRPPGVALERWLSSFPSFGFLLSVAPENVAAVTEHFSSRDIAAADIGEVRSGSRVLIEQGGETETIWNYSQQVLLGCGQGARG
jgi:AIR synthase-related protein